MTQANNSPARTNGLSIASLVTGVLGLSLIAVIFGHIALNQINRTHEEGRGLAIAGLVLGYVGIAAWVVFWVLFVALFAVGAGISSI